jgi:ketosteroid isomerase-like protein
MGEDFASAAGRAYERLNDRDLEGFIATLHPEVEFESLIAEAEGTTFRGAQGARKWWALMEQALGGISFEPVKFEDLGGGAGIIEVRAGGEAGGVHVEQRMWQAALVRDGMPWRWRPCRTREEAIEQLESWRAD